ncbi:MAG: antibiotic biosynthesis monooxygenase [Alphaproteobacteria bacterium]|nr:antibiotic biosynthesis monooxygenase [Alphaproteobacteria bacterium]
MIVRVWTSRFDTARRAELEDFANRLSLPMFHRHDGCQGVLFAYDGEDWVTVTLWRDRDSIDRLNQSDDYQATVDKILAAGFLREPQTVREWTHAGGDLPAR